MRSIIRFTLSSIQLAILFLALTLESVIAQFPLVNDSGTGAVIVCQTRSDTLTVLAAKELQAYISRISGVQLPISEKNGRISHPNVYLGKSFLPANQLKRLESDPMQEAFIIYSEKNRLFMAGKQPIGDLYAVYTLLEEFLGCVKFNADEMLVPLQKSIVVPHMDRIWSPAFSFRIPSFKDRWNSGFCHWHKVNTFSDWGRWWVHSFHRLVPPEVYFDEHPEYFALVDGRRLQDGQLCLGNPEVIELLKTNLGREIELNPTANYWSVSQNDCYNYCECDLCQKIYDDYGSFSGAYIYMSNELAKAFPEKQISTLAYQFTRKAPSGIAPLPNVNIMFCSIECNRSMPLEEDHRSSDFVKDLKAWATITGNIFVWDYVVQFRNYLTPFPNFHVLQPNIQFFREQGGKMMFQQGSGQNWSDLSDLKQYLIAKLLWNPDLDADSVINRFIAAYYGGAALYIREYFDLTHAAIRGVEKEQRLDIYGFPVFYKDAHLTADLLLTYDQLMQKAEQAVSKDSVLLTRVWRARLPVNFAILDLALNTYLPPWPAVLNNKTNPLLTERLDRFVERCQSTGIKAINERNLSPEAYRDYAIGLLQKMVSPNHLDDASVKIQTQYSHKYPVGGEKALNDRLMGGLSYHFNWLGFEGEDMVVEATFPLPVNASAVSMNFMHAVESWIFLPYRLSVDVSTDGVMFNEVAVMDIDNSDRNYLDRSVPFRLTFQPQEVKAIRITALSMKTCPEWHRGFGKPSWIFIDELIVE